MFRQLVNVRHRIMVAMVSVVAIISLASLSIIAPAFAGFEDPNAPGASTTSSTSSTSGGQEGGATGGANDASLDATRGAVAGGSGSVVNVVNNTDGDTEIRPAGPVPNMIITNFTYGDTAVSAGSEFSLGFTYQNKGKTAIQNMVITVAGGESFAIAGGTNTFYVESLAAGAALTQNVPMQALNTAVTGAQTIAIAFKYEYIDQNVRNSANSDINISIPVIQPDRFEVNAPQNPDYMVVGEETIITLSYVNKGKADVANVEVSIEGDGFVTSYPRQYVGNIPSGSENTASFAFTPINEGSFNATLKLSYEDASGNVQTKEFPITGTVEPAIEYDESAWDVEEETTTQTMPSWIIPVAIIALIVLIVVIVLVVKKVRANHAQHKSMDQAWSDWESDNPQELAAAAGSTAIGEPSVADGEETTTINMNA